MSKANVFIIESNKPGEERLREGVVLKGILRLDGKATRYRYVLNKHGFKVALQEFKASKYRYLHIACHGSRKSISTTQDRIKFREFGEITRRHLKGRRLFISACWAVRSSLAREIFSKGECISLIGPNFPIYFGDAAIAWATFYHLMFQTDRKRMRGSNIRPVLRKIKRTFNVPFNYYVGDKTKNSGYRKVRWGPRS